MDDDVEIPGFSDKDIEQQLSGYFAQIESDYAAQVEPTVGHFENKKPEEPSDAD